MLRSDANKLKELKEAEKYKDLIDKYHLKTRKFKEALEIIKQK